MFEFSFLNAAAVIVTLAALFGYINHRWLGLPHAIGIVVIALLASLGARGKKFLGQRDNSPRRRGGASRLPRKLRRPD